MEAKTFLKPQEVAEELKISYLSVLNMVKRGDIRAIRIGGPKGRIRIPRAEIEKLAQG